jgi:hypothetical protein
MEIELVKRLSGTDIGTAKTDKMMARAYRPIAL